MYQLRIIGAIVQRKLLRLATSFLKKYASCAEVHCGPWLNPQASEKLASSYVRMRDAPVDVDHIVISKNQQRPRSPSRSVSRVIKMSESLAKMELQPFAVDKHGDEALRLYRLSIVEAAATGNLTGIEGFTSDADQESIERIEVQMKKRFSVGTHVQILSSFKTSLHSNTTGSSGQKGNLEYGCTW